MASFHGSLPVPSLEQYPNIKAKLLLNPGDADCFVPSERVEALKKALNAAGANWELNVYSGASHGFTVANADGKGMENLKYDAQADRRSWSRLLACLDELFARHPPHAR